MKIVLFSHSSSMGGSERGLAEIAEEATRRGHHVVTTVPSRGPLSNHFEDAGLATPRVLSLHRWMSRRGRGVIGIMRLIQCFLDIPRCVAFLLKTKPDVALINSSVTPGPMFASKICRIPSIIIVRELIVSGHTLLSALPKPLIMRLIGQLGTQVVTVSEAVRDQVGQGIVVHSNSVPSAHRHRPSKSSGGALKVVFLGSLMEDKRPEDAIRAVSLACSLGASLHLDIFGSGSARDISRLKPYLSACPDGAAIRLRGEAAGPQVALKEADLLIMTSTNEAFGRVTTEALMAGIPVLGYDAQGTAEVIRKAGGGLLVEADPHSMAIELVALAGDPGRMKALRDAARNAGEYWAANRSDAMMVDQIEKTLSLGAKST